MLLQYAGPEAFVMTLAHLTIMAKSPTPSLHTSHRNPRHRAYYEIIPFRPAKKEPNETIDSYCTQLSKIVESCKFTDVDHESASHVILTCQSHVMQSVLLYMTK